MTGALQFVVVQGSGFVRKVQTLSKLDTSQSQKSYHEIMKQLKLGCGRKVERKVTSETDTTVEINHDHNERGLQTFFI